jgi:hypothetical protein
MANRGRSGAQARAKQKLAQRVAEQKVNTTNLLTPGTALSGLVGSNNKPFDGITDTLDGVPVIRVENQGFQQMGRGVSKGGLPKSIQYAGTTLYGLKQGDDVLYRAATETPLMKTIAKETTLKPDTITTPIPSTGPRLDPNATEQYASNFKDGQANMGNIQDMYSDRKDLQEWAKANPALAQKAFEKAEAKAVKSGKASSAYDANETFKPSDIPEADRQNPVEQAAALGIKNLTNDAQVFKDNAMTALLTASQNPNVTPIVEGLTIPTTTNYADAFNQADVPDLQSMMNMEEQLGSLGIEGPKFAQSQKFKDLFQNTMLSK